MNIKRLHDSVAGIMATMGLLSSALILPLQAATCPITKGGYLGNQGVVSGNCDDLNLPPLVAFGSLSVNQNAPLNQVNRLNPTQVPTTNGFQNFQNPCAVIQNEWTPAGLVGPINPVRTGPFQAYPCRTGPAFIVPAYNFNTDSLINNTPPVYGEGLYLPNLTTTPSLNLFLSATETNQGGGSDYFNVSTEVVNSATCIVTYTPVNGTSGFIKDYHVMGNLFHDVYYENLTPSFACVQSIIDVAGNVPISIDGGNIQYLPLGSTVSGRSFQLFFPRALAGAPPYPPATMIIFAEDSSATPIQFTLAGTTGSAFILTATQPFTGFIRLATLSSQDPLPGDGAAWSQLTYYNPENTADASDSSNPPSTCAIENPTAPCDTFKPYSCMWWRTTLVQAIAPSAMSYYLLTPNQPGGWSSLFYQLTSKLLGPNWAPPTGGCFNVPVYGPSGDPNHPDASGITVMMPIIALQDYNLANQYFTDYYNHFNPAPGVNNQTYADGIVTSNYFLLQFNMMMAQFLSADSANFQTNNRQLPSYTITAPLDTYGIYAAHRRYIPVRADLTFTNQSATWSYTLSPLVNPGDGSNKTLVCFPFWKYLQGLTPGVVNTSPGGGQPLQNFIYNDVVKGTFYAAEAINGQVTFLEGGLPSWYGTDLFIPSTLTFSPAQSSTLNNILDNIFPNLIDPLPLFPEVYLNNAYTALRTVFMLANTGLSTAYFLNSSGQSGDIMTKSKPFIDNAKSVLSSYLIGRIPGSSFFVADRTTGGICVNGAGGIGDYPEGPNLQQINDSGSDFGNYVYNDHHFFAGYALLAAAMITEWELKYEGGASWVHLPVMGADGQQYKIADFVDFLWRDVHNPFQNDPDFPYDRYGLPWEGHSVANGMQYDPNTSGRNQESIAEDFNCWYGMNAFARVMLKTTLSSNETAKYEQARDFSDMNLKMNGTSAIMWFKNTNYWKAVPGPTSLAPSICVGQFSQVTVTNGQVNDNSMQNQVFQ